MKCTQSTTKDGNLYPTAFNALHALPTQMLHQEEHEALRHPLATYNLSIARIVEAFRSVLDELNQLNVAVTNETESLEFDPGTLLAAQKELLDSLASHIDDGYQILKAVYPAFPLKREERFADKWLDASGHGQVMRLYRDPITPYRRSFMPIVNHIKHATGRLRAFVMYDSRQRIGGYYLETEGRGGIVGSDPKIHPDNTALSFNRDLRYHFCHLYSVGEALKQALARAAQKDYGISLSLGPVSEENAMLEEVAERISALRFWFFPDEAVKVTPIVLFSRVGADRIVTVEETRTEIPFVMRSFQGHATFKGDGVTRNWRVPYMQYMV